MFKSVFTKYISTTLFILAISFIILTSILCTRVDDFAENEKTNSLVKVADTMRELMYARYEAVNSLASQDDFNNFIERNKLMLQGVVYALDAYTEDIDAFIYDASGNILLYNEHSQERFIPDLSSVSDEILRSISAVGSYSGKWSCDGIEYLTYALPMKNANDQMCGILFVCTPNFTLPGLNQSLVKAIALTCLWIMLATMIAIYLISDRITSPLKHMSRAAKSFASGHFDVRVPVTGHDEISELAAAFNSMASSLSSSEEMRRSFLANVSHDLRTPMTTISGFIDGIIDGTIPTDKHAYYLGIIRNEVRRLSRLVNSLLDITRIQAGERKFTKTAFDICEMARIIVIGFEQKIEEKRLDVEFKCDSDKMFAWADRDAIYQILYNICDNAVKFSTEGAKYRITITQDGDKIRTSVYNEGIGIKSDEIPFVFERFYKSDKSRGLDKTGVGLGMFIAKAIIDAHNEKIYVESEYGKYCEFTFTLPYIREAQINESKMFSHED